VDLQIQALGYPMKNPAAKMVPPLGDNCMHFMQQMHSLIMRSTKKKIKNKVHGLIQILGTIHPQIKKKNSK
jgi:hypothetical protein